MKAISLPIEIIIIIAVAVLVLTVVTALFLSQAGRNYTFIEHQRALAQGCSILSFEYGCDASRISGIRIPGYGFECSGSATGTLEAACCALGHEYKDTSSGLHCAYTACKCLQPAADAFPQGPPGLPSPP